jgi:uncharacterized membrane protein
VEGKEVKMKGNVLRTGRLLAALFFAAVLASAQQQQRVARPGALNYIEGQVTLDGRTIQPQQIGSLEAAPGQVLATTDGRAEMLLTPGVFLRLGSNSAVKMIVPSLTNTRVELLRGKAMVEADQLEKENHLDIIDHGVNTVLEKKGIYEFNANNPAVAVYDGKARVQQDDRSKDVGKGKRLALADNPGLKVQKFNRNEDQDELYAWSKLRSEYMAQANQESAQMVYANNPGWWSGAGWYWSPWYNTWAFLPGDGFLYSPFGFPYYSPGFWYNYAPYYGLGRGYFPGGRWHARPPLRTGPVFHGGSHGSPSHGFSGGRFGGFGAGHGGGGGHFGGGGHAGGRR